jgi:integrase/recombinase XerD
VEGVAGSNPVGPTILISPEKPLSPLRGFFDATPKPLNLQFSSLEKQKENKKSSKTSAQLRHFVSVSEAAQILGVYAKTVTRWCESGKLAAIPRQYGKTLTYEISRTAVDMALLEQEERLLRKEKGIKQCTIEPKDVKELVKPWIKAMEKGLMNGKAFSHTTIEIYELYVLKFLDSHTALSLQTLKLELLSIPAAHFAKREKIYKSLICFGKYLISEGYLSASFLDSAKDFRPKRHIPLKRTTVNGEELKALLSACESPLDRLLVLLLVSTGLRASEACSLTYTTLSIEKGILSVENGKGGKTRQLGISSDLADIMIEYLASLPGEYKKGCFLRNKDGKAMSRYGIRSRLNRIGKKVGVQVGAHALRRAFVTLNANKGRPFPMLQMACGHSDIRTTRSYCLTSENEVIEAMKTWD